MILLLYLGTRQNNLTIKLRIVISSSSTIQSCVDINTIRVGAFRHRQKDDVFLFCIVAIVTSYHSSNSNIIIVGSTQRVSSPPSLRFVTNIKTVVNLQQSHWQSR